MSDSLTSQAIKEIERLTRETVKPEFLHNPADPEHVQYLKQADGKVDKVAAEPKPVCCEMKTPEALVGYANDAAHLSDKAAVFYHETFVTFLHDRITRRDRAFCKLKFSPQWERLSIFAANESLFGQKDFIRLLRVHLRGCLPADSNLLALIRNLNFAASQNVAGAITHGRESMGRAVEARIERSVDIPEEIRLTVPVYENWTHQADILCAIELHPQEQKFQLTPYPLELRRALEDAMVHLAAVLGEQPAPCFYGSV